MNQVNLFDSVPAGLSDRQMRAGFNNAMAQAHASADPRYNIKAGNYDRAGISRGGMQRAQSGADAAKNLAAGVSRAYSQQAEDAAYNSRNALKGLVEQEQFAQQLGALQSQNAYANQMAALQQQQMGLNLLGGLLG